MTLILVTSIIIVIFFFILIKNRCVVMDNIYNSHFVKSEIICKNSIFWNLFCKEFYIPNSDIKQIKFYCFDDNNKIYYATIGKDKKIIKIKLHTFPMPKDFKTHKIYFPIYLYINNFSIILLGNFVGNKLGGILTISDFNN